MNGTLALTFSDSQRYSGARWTQGNNSQWRVDLEITTGNISTVEGRDVIRSAGHADWFMLVNGSDLYFNIANIQYYEPEQ